MACVPACSRKRFEPGSSKTVLITLIATTTAVGGATTFFVAHPKGRELFSSFLEFAAGRADRSERPEEASSPKYSAPPRVEPQPVLPQESPARREALELMAQARRRLAEGDPDGAETSARTALAKDPSLAEEVNSFLPIVSTYRTQAAAATSRAALESAREFLSKGELDRAKEWTEKALAAVPNNPEALKLLHEIAQAREKNLAERQERRARADSLAQEGVQALAAGDYTKALELALEALKLDPDNTAAKLLRTQAEGEQKRIAEAKAQPKPEPVAEQPKTPIYVEVERPVLQTEVVREPIALEVQPAQTESPPPERTSPIVLEDVTAPGTPEKAPVTVEAPAPEPTAAKSETPPVTEIPQEVQAVVVTLAQLDRAMERKDLAALERLISESYTSGVSSRSSRTEELENAQAFFSVASDIHIERTTYEKDIRADPLRAEVRSYFRISYSIGPAKLSRAYKALYKLARDRGQWRIAEVIIEEEGP